MPTWIQSGNDKINLDRASHIHRAESGLVTVELGDGVRFNFPGDSGAKVWALVQASDVGKERLQPKPGSTKVVDPARRRQKDDEWGR